MNILRTKCERGYTLVELLVYVSLVSLLFLTVIQTALSIHGIYKRSRAFMDINSAGITAFSRFSRDIRRATAVDVVNSSFNSPEGRLVLLMKKEDGSSDSLSFYLFQDVIKVDENGVYKGDITDAGTKVSVLSFVKLESASTTAIRVNMTVVPQKNSSVPASNLYGTYVLRGSYVQ